jgi:hypothetical protein
MKRMTFRRPTTHYDERIKKTDEKICELIKQRKEISNNNPGYPPFEYITNWAEKFGLYEELLKSIFGLLWNEKMYKPFVEPENFRRNLPVLKSIEVDNRLFSITYIHQYSNSSIVNFNIDWDNTSDSSERQSRHTHFELFIDERYDCRMANGTGGDGHFHYNFIVSPPLPDNTSGIELFFKEYNKPFGDEQISHNIVIRL